MWDFAERFDVRCSPRSDNIFPSVFFFGKLIVFCMLFEYFSLDCSTDILQLSTIPDKTSPKIIKKKFFFNIQKLSEIDQMLLVCPENVFSPFLNSSIITYSVANCIGFPHSTSALLS